MDDEIDELATSAIQSLIFVSFCKFAAKSVKISMSPDQAAPMHARAEILVEQRACLILLPSSAIPDRLRRYVIKSVGVEAARKLKRKRIRPTEKGSLVEEPWVHPLECDLDTQRCNCTVEAVRCFVMIWIRSVWISCGCVYINVFPFDVILVWSDPKNLKPGNDLHLSRQKEPPKADLVVVVVVVVDGVSDMLGSFEKNLWLTETN